MRQGNGEPCASTATPAFLRYHRNLSGRRRSFRCQRFSLTSRKKPITTQTGPAKKQTIATREATSPRKSTTMDPPNFLGGNSADALRSNSQEANNRIPVLLKQSRTYVRLLINPAL